MKKLELILDVDHRWNSSYQMIKRAIRMRKVSQKCIYVTTFILLLFVCFKAIERFVTNSDREPDIKRLEIYEDEWEYLSLVMGVLEVVI